MDCQNVKNNIEKYLANGLSRRKAQALEKHLETCSFCQAFFLKEDEEMDGLLASHWYAKGAPAGLRAGVMERISVQKGRDCQFNRSKAVVCFVSVLVYCFLWLGGFAGYLLVKSIHPQVLQAIGAAIGGLLEHYSITPLGTVIFLTVLVSINWSFYYLDRKERMA